LPIASMTGFARSQGQDRERMWTWELRSVNGRGLEVRCRLPAGWESIEGAVRERAGKRFKRGNLTLSLAVARPAGSGAVRVNHAVLDELLALIPDINRRLVDFRPPSAEGMLALRGVLEPVDEEVDEAVRAELERKLLASLDEALTALAAARSEEGGRLEEVLAGHLHRLATLADAAARLAAGQATTIRDRLRQQLAVLADTLPEDRLIQEAAVLAARADPSEEIDRLKAHLAAARQLMDTDAPVGRRLDFLCQELNREANTLCSKSSDVELTRTGLALKATIDQFREQVQNIE
jgi:uncharacterized protein (TIGR00255 family)